MCADRIHGYVMLTSSMAEEGVEKLDTIIAGEASLC